VAVRPPDEVLDAVAEAVAGGRAVGDGLRWEERDRWHLTLQFLGPLPRLVPVVEALAAAVGERTAFAFRLGGAGAFPNPRRARVVWIGATVGGDALIGLAGAVSAALRPAGFEADRPLHPHLTVARLKVPGDAGPVLAALGPEAVGPDFTVSEVVLYESRLSAAGPKYTVLERFPFRNA
jgi:RNA 2',3'-cyclic 3'-phosphodiesterase